VILFVSFRVLLCIAQLIWLDYVVYRWCCLCFLCSHFILANFFRSGTDLISLLILLFLLLGAISVRENMWNLSKKRKKSCFFWIFKKNVKKRNHLVMQPLITQLQEVGIGKSRSPTSNILLRSVDTRNYATENCVW